MTAASECFREGTWLRGFLQDLGEVQIGPTYVFTDNSGAVASSLNPVEQGRSKHLEEVYHYIRERILDGEFLLHWISTHENMADLMTKAVTTKTFDHLIELLYAEKHPEAVYQVSSWRAELRAQALMMRTHNLTPVPHSLLFQ